MPGVASDGGYAQYVKLRAEDLLPIRGLDFKTAAALPVNFGTAWNGLVTRAKVKAGDSVLVWATGSGLGYAAVQGAKRFGAKVIATAGSDAKLELGVSHGAEYAVNHSK